MSLKTAAAPPPLTSGASIFLDLLRLSAALAVAFGHLTQHFFGTCWSDHTTLAVNAVTVFFLLSGFIIRFVTVRNPASLHVYAIDRASRIYSVILPALAFTLFADTLARHFNPAYYLPSFGAHYNHVALRLVVHCTFISELWHQDIAFLSNSPTWSLALECFYYAFYGIFFYLRGTRRILLLAAAMLLAGPGILLLFPLWIAGCLLFECFIRLRESTWAVPALSTLASFTTLLFTGSAPLRSGFVTLYARADRLLHINHASAAAYLSGAVAFPLMLLGLLLADRIHLDLQSLPSRTIRLFAEATFPLYLFHFPLFVLAFALVPAQLASAPAKLTLLGGAFILSAGLGVLLNRFKLTLRHFFRSLTSTSHASDRVRSRLLQFPRQLSLPAVIKRGSPPEAA